MVPRFMFALMVLAWAVLPAGAQTTAANPDAMAIAQGIATAAQSAIDKQDAAAWAGLSTRDVTILPVPSPLAPSGVVHGQADAEKMFAGMFKMGIKHADIKILEAHFIGRSALWWVGTIHFSGGPEIDARIAQVVVRVKGVWEPRLVVLSGNPPRAS
jgi:ketosteroid isomerase-like protein